MPPPRALACNPLGSVFGVASEQLECGRARYQKGELEPALAEFQAVLGRGGDRAVVREARYWTAETMLRLGRRDAVINHFDIVAKDDPRGELGAYATHSLGWVVLERGESERALEIFQRFLRGSVPPDLVPTARHGRALALHAVKRYPEARDEWTALLNRSVPRPLAAEASYWLGDTLGRLGDPGAAAQRLQIFTAAGPQLLIESGLMRLGWWRREAGQPLEAVKTYRGLLTAYPRTAEAAWARAGLVRALLDLDDYPAARAEAACSRRRTARAPSRGRCGCCSLATSSRRISPRCGDAARRSSLGLDARRPPPAPTCWCSTARPFAGPARPRRHGTASWAPARARAAPRSARSRARGWRRWSSTPAQLEQARDPAERLLAEAPPPAVRAVATIIAAEASYGLRQYDRAAANYRRVLAEPSEPTAGASVRLALGWAELRRGRPDAARAEWVRFVRRRGAGFARARGAPALRRAERAARATTRARARCSIA